MLYVIGLGPGEYEKMTVEAVNALEASDIIVGYTAYTDLVKPHFPNKEYYQTAMTKEVVRCEKAVEIAMEGKNVAMVCSGDSGVYGMANLIYSVADKVGFSDIKVIPGVSACLSGGAVLGAPLTHDFCVLSLSDLLTPMEVIQKRLHACGAGDFAVAIYNPSSMKRSGYLKMACDILMGYKSPQTVCGYVQNIGRDGEKATITTLDKLADENVDMFTTVFIGNADTIELNGKMVTPRGYKGV